MQKAVHSNFRALDLPSAPTREHAGDDASEVMRATGPLTAAAACLTGLLLASLIPWLWTAAAWASGMRPEALAVVVVVTASAAAAGATLTTAAATAHRFGGGVVTALLFTISLAKLPLGAGASTLTPESAASAMALSTSIAGLAGLPIAALAAAVTLLSRRNGSAARRWAGVGAIAMLLLYPLAIDAAYTLATQAGVWMAGFVLAAMLTLGAVARGDAPPETSDARDTTAGTGLSLLHAAAPAAILPPLLTDVAGASAPLALPGCAILAVTLGAALLTKSTETTPKPTATVPSPLLVVLACLVLLAVVLPETSVLRLLAATAALAVATSLHARAVMRREPHSIAIGVALGTLVGMLVTRLPLPWSPLALVLITAVATSPEVRPGLLEARTLRRCGAAALIAIATSLVASTLVQLFGTPARIALALAFVPAALFIVQRTRFWPERNIVCLIAALAATPVVPTAWKPIGGMATAWSPLRLIERVDGPERRVLSANARIAREPSSPPPRLADAVDIVRRIKRDEFAGETDIRRPLLIGTIGNAGSIVCAAQPTDVVRVFEADPAIAAIAADPLWLKSFSRCAPGARVIAGDPRRSLPREPDDAFDVLLLDATAFAAPPLHLLTSDMLAVMASKLSPTGILALDIGHDSVDLSAWLARAFSGVGGVQVGRIGRDLVLATPSAAIAGEIATWPETNGLERLPRSAVPHHFDLIAAMLDRRASARR